MISIEEEKKKVQKTVLYLYIEPFSLPGPKEKRLKEANLSEVNKAVMNVQSFVRGSVMCGLVQTPMHCVDIRVIIQN